MFSDILESARRCEWWSLICNIVSSPALAPLSTNKDIIEHFKKYNNLSTDKPEEDSLDAVEYFIIKADIEIRKNSGEKTSAIFYYDKAISMAERIFSDNYIDK